LDILVGSVLDGLVESRHPSERFKVHEEDDDDHDGGHNHRCLARRWNSDGLAHAAEDGSSKNHSIERRGEQGQVRKLETGIKEILTGVGFSGVWVLAFRVE